MARMACGLHVYPLWSLSVEDLLPWRRLYSATSAVPIPAWSPRCAVSSSVFATWKPSLCGFRKRTMPLLPVAGTRTACLLWTASRRLPDDEHRGAPLSPQCRERDTAQQENEPGTPRGVPLRSFLFDLAFRGRWLETHSWD